MLLLLVVGTVFIFPDMGFGAHVVRQVGCARIWQCEGIGLYIEHEVRIASV